MTELTCKEHGHTVVSGSRCDACGQVVPELCYWCGARLYFTDRTIGDGACGACRRMTDDERKAMREQQRARFMPDAHEIKIKVPREVFDQAVADGRIIEASAGALGPHQALQLERPQIFTEQNMPPSDQDAIVEAVERNRGAFARLMGADRRDETDDELRARIKADLESREREDPVYVANLDGMTRGEPMRLTTDAPAPEMTIAEARERLEGGDASPVTLTDANPPAAVPAPTERDILATLKRAAEPLTAAAEQLARPRLAMFAISSWEIRVWMQPHRSGEHLLIHARLRTTMPLDPKVKPAGSGVLTEEAHARMGWETLASEQGGDLLAMAALELAGAVIGRTTTRLIDAGIRPKEIPVGDGKTCKCGAANPMPHAIKWQCALCGEVNLGPIGAQR